MITESETLISVHLTYIQNANRVSFLKRVTHRSRSHRAYPVRRDESSPSRSLSPANTLTLEPSSTSRKRLRPYVVFFCPISLYLSYLFPIVLAARMRTVSIQVDHRFATVHRSSHPRHSTAPTSFPSSAGSHSVPVRQPFLSIPVNESTRINVIRHYRRVYHRVYDNNAQRDAIEFQLNSIGD